MPDYSKGQIYTIRNREDNAKIYVGSTIQPLYKRFHGHKIDSKKDKNKNIKLYIEVNGDWDIWYIELYENCPCSSKEELLKREGEVIRLIGTLNVKIEGRSKTEYKIENKEKIKEQQKQYYLQNADKFKEYYLENTDKAKQYRIENADKIKERKKQYRIENADKLKERRRQYYLKKRNDDKINH